jgi:hypothetical protein
VREDIIGIHWYLRDSQNLNSLFVLGVVDINMGRGELPIGLFLLWGADYGT